MAKTTETLSDFVRLGCSLGSAPTFTLSGGFGSTATATQTGCTDAAGRVLITCAGTGQGASPTATIAYSTPYSERAPHMLVSRAGGSQATITMSVTSEFTTAAIVTFNGTAAGTETYTFNYFVIG